MPNPNDSKPKFQTFTRRVRGFLFFEEETVSSESPSDSSVPSAPNQTSGVGTSERLRPSRPCAPGLVAVRQNGNVFSLASRRKAG